MHCSGSPTVIQITCEGRCLIFQRNLENNLEYRIPRCSDYCSTGCSLFESWSLEAGSLDEGFVVFLSYLLTYLSTSSHLSNLQLSRRL